MKNLNLLISLFLLIPFMLFAQQKENKEIILVTINLDEHTKDTCIHIEKKLLSETENLLLDSLGMIDMGKIIFIDKEGMQKVIHPDSLNLIPINLIKKITLNGMIVIKENLTTEDCTIKKDNAAKNKKKIKHIDITLDISIGEEKITDNEIEKIKTTIKNIFQQAEIDIKKSKNQAGQEVIHVRVVQQNEK
ncbi:MAG: hypothetical protein SVU94_05350 [Bacteroidota bacterium]|nr:hypothetical protein [Bacteroidota bacterium]